MNKVGQTIALRGLSGLAFRPRSFMKTVAHALVRAASSLTRRPGAGEGTQECVRHGGFSTLPCRANHGAHAEAT